MKKSFLVFTGLLLFAILNGQTLEDIVKKNFDASKQSTFENIKTIRMTGSVNQMGIEMPMTIYLKNPNKIKVTISYNSMDIVQVTDGVKAYMINPMLGSATPIELPADQANQFRQNNGFKSPIMTYFNEKRLSLDGEELIKGKPAFKLKANLADSSIVYMFIDKESYLPVKTRTTVTQMGIKMDIESYLTDYTDFNGVLLPKTTTTYANGMESAVMKINNVEIDIPVEDSIFSIK